jgi:hypothetical protein
MTSVAKELGVQEVDFALVSDAVTGSLADVLQLQAVPFTEQDLAARLGAHASGAPTESKSLDFL